MHTLGPSYAGTVVLDIGFGTGALILHTGPDRHHDEIHVGPDSGGPRIHSSVRERRLGARPVYCAVYPGLEAGDYTVWGADGAPIDTVTIVGGEVTSLHI
jgi:hypothetical protein